MLQTIRRRAFLLLAGLLLPLSAGAATSPPLQRPSPAWERPSSVRQIIAIAAYGAVYGMATKVGSRFGLEGRFRMIRLESAYVYDLVGHAFVVREMGTALTYLTRSLGYPEAGSRKAGVWWGAFGSELYMEWINGFMPGVRFDPLDPVANFVGAWLATGGHDLAQRHPFLGRFSLQFGYKSWSRVFGPAQDSAPLGNIWHDHANGRFGVGFDIGPRRNPWVTLLGTYEITSLTFPDLRNRFGAAVEIHPLLWLSGLIERLPGGHSFLAAHRWLDRRIMIPGFTFQLGHFDVGPFSGREPFQE